MRYLGGKSRVAKQIASVINPIRAGRFFWDPFCGGLSVAVALGGAGMVSDIHPALITLYKETCRGWRPPEVVSFSDWTRARSLPDTDPFKAFAGFACSYGGKWFGGYAENVGPRVVQSGPAAGKVVTDDYARASARKILHQCAELHSRGCEIEQIDFLDVDPWPDFGGVLYLDPPYRGGVTGYSMPFDHERFDARVQQWARITDVFVSEYALPYGREVWTRAQRSGINQKQQTERLYWVRA